LSRRRWRSSGFNLPSGPNISAIELGLVPEEEEGVFAGGVGFFWSLFFECTLLFWLLPVLAPEEFWLLVRLLERLSERLLEEDALFVFEVGWLVVDRLSLLISDWRSQ